MKKFKINSKNTRKMARIISEDMRELQKRISGRSVYARYRQEYERRPKHKKRGQWQTI
jgi:hypothetical protein